MLKRLDIRAQIAFAPRPRQRRQARQFGEDKRDTPTGDRRDLRDNDDTDRPPAARALVLGPNHAHIGCMDVLTFTGTRADPPEIVPCRLHD